MQDLVYMDAMGLLERHMGKILVAVILVASVATLLGAYDLQRALRMDTAPPPGDRAGESRATAADVPTLRPKDQYEVIVRRNLFGPTEGAGPRGGGAEAPQKTKAETALNVRLKGTIVSPHGFALAMIEDSSQRKEDLYIVGDKVQDAEILKILSNQVVLRRAGKEETLTLFTEHGSQTPGRPSGPVPGGGRPEGPRHAPAAVASGGTGTPPQQRNVQQHVQGLMAQLRLKPHFQEGKPSGFVVGQIQSGSVFEAAGVKEGDIIVAINDEDVRTPNQLLKAYREVAGDRELWLDIIRDGVEQTIEVDLDKVLPKD